MQQQRGISASLVAAAPAIFVVLWSTGYIGARYGTEYAEPFTFLFIRFLITFGILSAIVSIAIGWRGNRMEMAHSFFSGVLVQGVYLGGIFYAVHRGMPAGIAALVVALQPFITAIAARMMIGEKLSVLRGLFFVSALAGIILVLFPDLDFRGSLPGITLETFATAIIGTVAISFGAVYQKKHVRDLNLWVSTTAQFAGGALVVGVAAFAVETREVTWNLQLILTLAWLIVVLSIGAVALLMYLIRQGSASSVASLFFLVPVVAGLMAWVLFGETLNAIQLAGSLVVVISVALSSRITDH